MLLPPLGIGSFGEVRKALHKISGVLRAIKIMAKDHMSPEEHDRMLYEVNIMQNMDHPHVIKIYEYFED